MNADNPPARFCEHFAGILQVFCGYFAGILRVFCGVVRVLCAVIILDSC